MRIAVRTAALVLAAGVLAVSSTAASAAPAHHCGWSFTGTAVFAPLDLSHNTLGSAHNRDYHRHCR